MVVPVSGFPPLGGLGPGPRWAWPGGPLRFAREEDTVTNGPPVLLLNWKAFLLAQEELGCSSCAKRIHRLKLCCSLGGGPGPPPATYSNLVLWAPTSLSGLGGQPT